MFSVIIPGRPCLTDMAPVDTEPNAQPTKFVFTFPSNPRFNHIVVFFLPGTILPPDAAAAIYIQLPERKRTPTGPQFKFLGAIANEKPSAIFRIGPEARDNQLPQMNAEGDDDMLDEDPSSLRSSSNDTATLGISIEPAQSVAAQIAALNSPGNGLNSPTALARQTPQQKETVAKILAQRIITNAFNFLASFAESDSKKGGEEVVPLKTFRDWWLKFERRVEMDPGFLEREDSGQV
jgi:protein Hikeshi